MLRIICKVVAAIMLISFTGCASTPRIEWRPEIKQKLKKIAIIETPEQERYSMNPGQSKGGAVLYMFGALGGAILGGIEAKRQNAATEKFTEAIVPLEPNLTQTMITSLEKGLLEKGYDIRRVPPPPKTEDNNKYDISKIEGGFDAVIVAELNGGYTVDSNTASPLMTLAISIYSNSGKELYFSDKYLYYTKKIGEHNQVSPDAKYVFESIDALYEHIHLVVEGLRVGAEKMSALAIADV